MTWTWHEHEVSGGTLYLQWIERRISSKIHYGKVNRPIEIPKEAIEHVRDEEVTWPILLKF